MIVTFTLQGIYSGATYVAGPFNISGTTSSGVTTELATGLTKEDLLTGYTINGVDDLTTGGTIASTGICLVGQSWCVFDGCGGQPTPTPTETPVAGTCWSYTYSTFNQPTGISARWTDPATGQVFTELITNLDSMDNGDNTITAYLCVSNVGLYTTPVCVQSGIEVTCPVSWVSNGCSCTDGTTCFVPCD
jgi:hypothetical protein